MSFPRIVLAIALLTTVALAAQEAGEQPRPGDAGQTERGIEFRAPETAPIELRQPETLRVDSFDIHELAEGTHSGEPGDLLLTVRGRGFLETSRSPQIELGGEVVFEDTVTDLEGTVLFAIISRETAERIRALDFSELVVRNPGGRDDTDYGRAVLEATPRKLARPAASAPKARLLFKDGVYVRELIGG